MIRIFTGASQQLPRLVSENLQAAHGHLSPRRILLKPNWVMHEEDPAFPIRALVTDPRVIEATAEACLRLFPSAESILIADCPLQSADWPLMCRQCGLDAMIERLTRLSDRRVQFRDLRREVFRKADGTFLERAETDHGDPRGYREVSLGTRSHLEPLASSAHRFAVNDYSAAVTRSNHRPGDHRYLVAQSVLDADLIINLPKWKTHQKAGITAALKNLVGINGDKAYLPHFRRGAPAWGGDEYADEHRWLYWAQTTIREKLQKRHRLGYKLLKPGWELLKRCYGIQTRLTDTRAAPGRFYVAGGSWPGNDTLWRMVYDLNLIIQCADAEGRLHDTPQREYFCIVDGLVSGEGNGPLQPLPRETNCLAFGKDPFEIDAALCHFMGFDPARVPLTSQRQSYAGPAWGKFALDELQVELDGVVKRLTNVPLNFQFTPPPGWRSRVERDVVTRAAVVRP